MQTPDGPDETVCNDRPRQVADVRKQTGFDPASYVSWLDRYDPVVMGLGISPSTLTAFRAGYCKAGTLKGRLAIGLCKADHAPWAFVGVGLNGEPLIVPRGVVLPAYLGVQLVGEGTLHLYNSAIEAMQTYEEGTRNTLVLLKPITADTLKSLWLLMEVRNCKTLEIHF